jgi:hypothetical protein
MKLRGGFSVSIRDEFLHARPPSNSTITPCEELLTQPASPSSFAKR